MPHAFFKIEKYDFEKLHEPVTGIHLVFFFSAFNPVFFFLIYVNFIDLLSY